MQRPATQREAMRRIYFNQANSVTYKLSNMFLCDLDLWGITFSSAEQAYQWAKLEFLDEQDIARQVMSTQNPMKVKKRAGKISREQKDWWRDSGENIVLMNEVLNTKYKQVYTFQVTMDACDNAYFCEDTRDKYWGIGCTKEIADGLPMENLPGENVLGRLLMLTARTRGKIVMGYDIEEAKYNLDYDVLQMM